MSNKQAEFYASIVHDTAQGRVADLLERLRDAGKVGFYNPDPKVPAIQTEAANVIQGLAIEVDQLRAGPPVPVVDKKLARRVLGFSDVDDRPVRLELRDEEALIDTIRDQNQRHYDRASAHNAAIEALEKRLQQERKKRRLANRRADQAENALHAAIDAFSENRKKGN